MVTTKRNFVNNKKSQTGGGSRRGTVGQEAGELICQTEWKTRQKEVTALWTLLSSKLKCFSIRVTIKLSFGFFCFFALSRVTFGYWGQNQPVEWPKWPHTGKSKVSQVFIRIWGRYDPIELGPSEPQQARKLQATLPSPKLRLTDSLTRWRGWSVELLA